MRSIALILAFAFAVTALVWAYGRFAPAQHNVFRPLSVNDPIGAATHQKLSLLFGRREACFMALDGGGIAYTPLDQSPVGQPCGFYDAVTLGQSALPYPATLPMTGPLRAALAGWERQVVMPAAEDILGSPVISIETFGSYACRRMYGRTSGSYSEHATANAIDISGFRLADGRYISVLKHWGRDTPEGRYLKTVRDRSYRVFSVVLSPDYNRAHADHFHFDMGSGDVCS